MTKIKEVFTSIQGEGPYVGFKQIFIRFCACNLNCSYCDTDFISDEKTKDYTPEMLANLVNNMDAEFVSLTGGEPLLFVDFLKEFIPLCKHKIYLETNGTLPNALANVISLIDVVASDVKLSSCTSEPSKFDIHDEFLRIASKKEVFLKVVFNSKITNEEIEKVCYLGGKYGLQIVLQPMMLKDKLSVSVSEIESIFNKFYIKYENVRLIPQMHKFLSIQ